MGRTVYDMGLDSERYGSAHEVLVLSLEATGGLEKLHWAKIEPDVLFLVERRNGTLGDGAELLEQLPVRYRKLATRVRSHLGVVNPNNDSSVEDAFDHALAAITPFSPQPSRGMGSARDAQRTSPNTGSGERLGCRDFRQLIRPSLMTSTGDSGWNGSMFSFVGWWAAHVRGRTTPYWRATSSLTHTGLVIGQAQYLIHDVIYEGLQSSEEVFFRTLLFKMFNKIETWELLEASIGEIMCSSYLFDAYDKVLSQAQAEGRSIYSTPYIMPSAGRAFGYAQKHRNRLKLIERMIADELPWRIADARTMRDAFGLLRAYPSIGDFLAYQFVTDLNYGEITDFSEMEFLMPGPGALDGIHKCLSDLGGLTEADLIRVVTDRQEEKFDRLGLRLRDL